MTCVWSSLRTRLFCVWVFSFVSWGAPYLFPEWDCITNSGTFQLSQTGCALNHTEVVIEEQQMLTIVGANYRSRSTIDAMYMSRHFRVKKSGMLNLLNVRLVRGKVGQLKCTATSPQKCISQIVNECQHPRTLNCNHICEMTDDPCKMCCCVCAAPSCDKPYERGASIYVEADGKFMGINVAFVNNTGVCVPADRPIVSAGIAHILVSGTDLGTKVEPSGIVTEKCNIGMPREGDQICRHMRLNFNGCNVKNDNCSVIPDTDGDNPGTEPFDPNIIIIAAILIAVIVAVYCVGKKILQEWRELFENRRWSSSLPSTKYSMADSEYSQIFDGDGEAFGGRKSTHRGSFVELPAVEEEEDTAT